MRKKHPKKEAEQVEDTKIYKLHLVSVRYHLKYTILPQKSWRKENILNNLKQ